MLEYKLLLNIFVFNLAVVCFCRQRRLVSNSLFLFNRENMRNQGYFIRISRDSDDLWGYFLDKLLLFSAKKIKKPGMVDPNPV